jgi:cold shock CspA family protein
MQGFFFLIQNKYNMSTLYNPNYLLTNHDELKLDTTTDSSDTQGIKKFYKKLHFKGLVIDSLLGEMFFKNPYELFAALVKGDKRQAEEVKCDVIECIRDVADWKAFMPELEFLQLNKLVLSQFLRNPDSPIFLGFLLILLAALYKYQLKIYQFYEGKSLISCEIGSHRDISKVLRLAIVIFPDGFKFSILKKAKVNAEDFDFDSLWTDVKFENKMFEIHLTKNDMNALRVLTENLGFFPQLIVDYSDLLTQKQYYGNSKTELSHIFENIMKINTNTDLNSKDNATRVLRIENLGIENLNSRLKAELIFGNKVLFNPFQKIKEHEFENSFSVSKPPGLKEKYLDGSMILHNTDGHPDKRDHNDKSVQRFNSVATTEAHNKISEDTESGMKEMKSFKEIAAVKPVILDQNKEIRFVGKLKFVNEKNKYGFLVKELDGSDVFFHLSDMENAGITSEILLKNKDLRFSFAELKYIGRHNISKKAVELKLHQE